MSSIMITITKVKGTNYTQWPTEMALLLEQKPLYGINKEYEDKAEEEAANETATGKAAFIDWMNHHAVAGSTILLGMEPRIQVEYMVIDDVKMLWEKLSLAYKSRLTLNIVEIMEDLWSIKLEDCWDVDHYALQIDLKGQDSNVCAGPLTTDIHGTDTISAKTIARLFEQEHIFYLLHGIARNDKCKVFLALRMDENATMTATPDEIVTMLVEKEVAIKRETGLPPEALLFQKKGGKGGNGSNGGKAGKGSKSPERDKRDKRDNKNDRKEKKQWKCMHCQQWGHVTENFFSQKCYDSPKAADIAANASTETTSTCTTSIENY